MDSGAFQRVDVMSSYGQPPVSYYISALLLAENISETLFNFGRGSNSPNKDINNDFQVYVFCEDSSNPVCKHFHSAAQLQRNVHWRGGGNFLEDMHIMMCSTQIIQAMSTMNIIFKSSRARVFHDFPFRSLNVIDEKKSSDAMVVANRCAFRKDLRQLCSCSHAIKDENQRVTYEKQIHEHWANSPYQRSLMETDYQMVVNCI